MDCDFFPNEKIDGSISSMFLKRKKSQRFGASSFSKFHHTRQKNPFATLGMRGVGCCLRASLMSAHPDDRHDLELQYAVHDGRKHAHLQSFHANNVESTTAEHMHVLRIKSATPVMYACQLSWIIFLCVFGILPFHRVGTSQNLKRDLKTVQSSTVSG